MPKSLGQEILFTILMVFVMFYAMIVLLVSCDNATTEERTYKEIDASDEIAQFFPTDREI
ncbi:MAG: hypothetical protein IJS09_02300 [Treponema sp.]|nr:hypothetical protein [Treponema sp.]